MSLLFNSVAGRRPVLERGKSVTSVAKKKFEDHMRLLFLMTMIGLILHYSPVETKFLQTRDT